MTLEQALKEIADMKATQAKTNTDNEALIKKLKGENETLQKEPNDKITKLNSEAAESRVLKQQERKRNYILKEVLKRNNINFDVDGHSLDGLVINSEGAVEGDVTYTAGKTIEAGMETSPATIGGAGVLTLEDVQSMSREQVESNWDAVQQAMTA